VHRGGERESGFKVSCLRGEIEAEPEARVGLLPC